MAHAARYTWKASLISIASLCFLFQAAHASYIDELEHEAVRGLGDRQGSLANAPVSPTSNSPTLSGAVTHIGDEEHLQSGLDRAAFEYALRQEFYGSFVFYSTLSEEHKSLVYQAYTHNNEIEHLRRVIRTKMR